MTGGAEGADSGEAERHPDCPAIAKSARLSKAAQGRLRASGQVLTSRDADDQTACAFRVR